MSYNHALPKKIDLKPKKHHGFQFFLFLLGLLLPPLAVAARFGIGKDLFINIILCICGYFPCHFHNFYIQNIRNNTNRARTPKWALKAGLVNTDDRDRRARKNEWSKRFEQRNAQSAHVGQPLEEGEEGEDYLPVSDAQLEAERRRAHEHLWEDDDAEYYNPDEAPNQRSWHYPMNFEGTATGTGRKQKKKAGGGDRWERSRASRSNSTSSGSTYPPAASVDDDVPEWGRDYGSSTRRSTKNKQQQQQKAKHGRGGWADTYADDVARDDGWGASDTSRPAQKQSSGRSGDDVFNHQF